MDPNATLKKIHELLGDVGSTRLGQMKNHVAALMEACEDLDTWLYGHGFDPKWSDYPQASGFFVLWRLMREEKL